MPQPLLLEAYYALVDAHPDRVQFTQPVGGGKVVDMTRKQILNEALRVSAWMKAKGFTDGARVGILSKNCARFVAAELAIWMAGCSTVALFPTSNAENIAYVHEHSELKLLFVGKLDNWDALKEGVPEGTRIVTLPLAPDGIEGDGWDDIVASTEPPAERPTRAPDDIALLIYTSGSTGRPKGVMHSFGRASAAAHGIVEGLAITQEDRGLSYLPLAHVFERAYVECSSLIAGQHIFFAESLSTFVADLRRARPTLFISVPRLWLKFQLGVFKKMPPEKLALYLKIPIFNKIVRKKVLTNLGLDSVRLAGSGSAPIPAELISWYRSIGLNLMEGYAMSEDFAFSHLSTPEHSEAGYVGVPYPGVEVRISEAGEILIKSPGTMVGYYKQPELTAECFTEDGFFKTGDRGERRPSGMLKITGRLKEIFKTSKGKYVAPAPIENLVNNDPRIELSCVSGSGMPQPYALCVLSEDLRPRQGDAALRAELQPKLEALLKDVNDKVAHHEHLQCLVVVGEAWDVDNGFLTPTMKIRRQSIEDAYTPKVEGWYEQKQAVVWA